MLSHYQLTQPLENMTGKRATHFKPVQGGYTPVQRLMACFSDGSSAFVKTATTELTNQWLRQEHYVYESLSAPFMPAYLGWHDDGEYPILLVAQNQHRLAYTVQHRRPLKTSTVSHTRCNPDGRPKPAPSL